MQNLASLTHLRRSGTCGRGVLHNALCTPQRANQDCRQPAVACTGPRFRFEVLLQLELQVKLYGSTTYTGILRALFGVLKHQLEPESVHVEAHSLANVPSGQDRDVISELRSSSSDHTGDCCMWMRDRATSRLALARQAVSLNDRERCRPGLAPGQLTRSVRGTMRRTESVVQHTSHPHEHDRADAHDNRTGDRTAVLQYCSIAVFSSGCYKSLCASRARPPGGQAVRASGRTGAGNAEVIGDRGTGRGSRPEPRAVPPRARRPLAAKDHSKERSLPLASPIRRTEQRGVAQQGRSELAEQTTPRHSSILDGGRRLDRRRFCCRVPLPRCLDQFSSLKRLA